MTCQTCRAMLSEQLETEHLQIAHHLRECPACRAELAALTRAVALLEAEPEPTAPDLQVGLWAKIEAAEAASARRSWERPVALGLATMLAGCVGGLLWTSWPMLLRWVQGFGGWLAPSQLGATATSALGSAMAGWPSDLGLTFEQARATWATAPVGFGPQTIALVAVAAAGALAVEWAARRDLGRLAPAAKGAR